MKTTFLSTNLSDISTDLLFELDTSGRIQYANMTAITAWNLENYLQLPLIRFLDAVSVHVFDNALNRVLTECQSYKFVLTDHNHIYSASLHPGIQGHLDLSLTDITRQHHTDIKLQQAIRRLNFAEKATQLGYWELDIATRQLFWSEEMYKIFGEEGKIHSPMRNLIKERMVQEDISIYKSKLKELLKTEKTVEGTLRLHGKKNKIIYCSFKAGIIYENHKKIIAGTFQDISQYINIQQELQAAKKKAEELSDAKSYFLAQASHDLRQPMQALKLFISGLKEENLNLMQKTLVKKIEDSALNLNTLLENLLDISKIEAGGVKYQPQIFDIGTIISNLAQEYQELAKKQNIRFRYIPLRKKIYSDPILLERLLRNLLNNAFKYTKNKVLFGAKLSGKSITIKIIDNGCGISPQELDKIFQDFYQSPQQPICRIQGVGLGLGIVKRIAKLLKTTVNIYSIPEKGSCFYFSLTTDTK